MPLFQYAVIERADTRVAESKDTLVTDITTVLAGDDAEVRLIAARGIPEGTDLGHVEVLVRPF